MKLLLLLSLAPQSQAFRAMAPQTNGLKTMGVPDSVGNLSISEAAAAVEMATANAGLLLEVAPKPNMEAASAVEKEDGSLAPLAKGASASVGTASSKTRSEATNNARFGSMLQDGVAEAEVMAVGAAEAVVVDPLGYMLAHPDELIALVFFVVSLIYFLATVLFRERERKCIERIKNEKSNLTRSYYATMNEMAGLLQNMNESSACFAQRNFNAKRRTFQKFMEKIKRDSEERGSEEENHSLLHPFRNFVRLWLGVFEQCSIDPLNEKKEVVTWQELLGKNSIAKVAELVRSRLDRNKVDFIDENLSQYENSIEHKDTEKVSQKEEFWISCSCGVGLGVRYTKNDDDPDDEFPIDILLGCLKVSLLSQSHSNFILSMFLGIAIGAMEFVCGKMLMAALVGAGEFCLLVILIGFSEFDRIARISREIRVLKKETEKIEQEQKQMNEFYTKMQKVTNLWLYHTVPRLDNLKELHEQIIDTSHEFRLQLMEGVCTHLDAIDKAMGPLELYCGECDSHRLPEDKLKLVADQLNRCTTFVARLQAGSQISPKEMVDTILFSLSRVLDFVFVRKIAAEKLTNKNYEFAIIGKSSHPYVTLQLDSTKEPVPRTSIVANDLSPEWDEEFFFPAHPEDNKLELHVWHRDEVSDDSSLGYYRLDFRNLLPGFWHNRSENLTSLRKGHMKDSSLEFQVLYANKVQQLMNPNSLGSKPRLEQSVTAFLRS